MSPSDPEFLFFEDDGEMRRFLGEKWREIASGALERRGHFSAALSGGKTPVGFYEYLASLEGLPWDKTFLFLVDERFVPPESAESNCRMLRETLLSRVPIPPRNIHAVSTLESSPFISAEKYEEELRNFFKLPEGGIPEFDLVLLGIGEDGHTASLFPGAEALTENRRLAVPIILDASLHDRVTLTLPVINHAENVIFLVSGKRKAAVMRRLIEEKDRTLPASMVKPEKGKLLFVMDREARE